jgi:hypothetical protein
MTITQLCNDMCKSAYRYITGSLLSDRRELYQVQRHRLHKIDTAVADEQTNKAVQSAYWMSSDNRILQIES